MTGINKLKINQGILFHVYNFIIPLVIPAIIIIALAYIYSTNFEVLIMTLLSQVFLYNTVVLSTNIGLLNQPKNFKDPFKDKNTAFSICLVIVNVILFSIAITSYFTGKGLNQILLVIFIILAFPLIYSTIYLLGKNKEAAFAEDPDISKLADERQEGDEVLIHKILEEDK